MSLYLEDFLELIEQLPGELRDRFTDMREMDLQVEKGLNKNEAVVREFFQRAPDLTPEERKRQYERIKEDYSKSLEDADEKVSLANNLHTYVERYLRKLDAELGKFKIELEIDNPNITESLEKKVLDAEQSGYAKQEKRRRLQQQQTVVNTVCASVMQNQQHLHALMSSLPATPSSVKQEFGPAVPVVAPLHISASAIGLSTLAAPGSSVVSSRTASPATPSSVVLPSPSSRPQAAVVLPPMPSASHAGQAASLQRRVQSYPKLLESRSLPFNQQQQLSLREDHRRSVATVTPPLTPGVKTEGSFQSAFLSQETTRSGRNRKINKEVGDMMGDLVRQRQRHTGGHEQPGSSSFGQNAPGGFGGEAAEDEESDPNEPRYCICNQVSYGEMVACDNRDCPFEWFHYPCVGIQQPPKGKWYCPQCTQAMRRRTARAVQEASQNQ